MFGYIRPNPDELRGKDWRLWREDYCGLCRCLGRRYGLKGRLLLRYDMTFLYALLTAAEQPRQAEKCWCPAGVICRKPCRPADGAMEYAADATMLLFYWKLDDEVRDGGFFRRTGARLLRGLYRRAYRKASAAQPEAARQICENLARLSALETAQSDSLDRTADAFASILRGFADYYEEETARRVAGQLLYHVGRYIYLVDALDDLRKDVRKDAYNPLRRRFSLENGALSPEDRRYLLQLVEVSISQAAAALALLPCGRRGALLENIVYEGMPGVLKAVAAGNYRKSARRSDAKER